MVVFLVFAIPAGALLYLKLAYTGFFDGGDVWRPFFRGVASFAISALPLYIITELYPVQYNLGSLYVRFFISDYLIFIVGALLFFFIWQNRKIEVSYGKPLVVHIFAFFAGYVAFIGLFQSVVHVSNFSAYRLFAYPFLIAIVFWYTGVCIYFYYIMTGWVRYIWFLAVFIPAILSAVVPIFHITSHILYTWLSAVLVLCVGAGTAVLLNKTHQLP